MLWPNNGAKIMANSWFRLYGEFINDPKMQMMSETYQRRYLMLLCLRCNDSETLHDESVAFQLRVTVTDWIETKTVFIEKNLIDSDNNIVAWDKRQYVSDSSSHRVAKHREAKKQACNVTVTSQDTDTDTDTDKKQKSTRASRLSEGWKPSEEDIIYCKTERPELTVSKIADNFRDYWISKAGKDACKTNWSATWRSWVRKESTGFQSKSKSIQTDFGKQDYHKGVNEDGSF